MSKVIVRPVNNKANINVAEHNTVRDIKVTSPTISKSAIPVIPNSTVHIDVEVGQREISGEVYDGPTIITPTEETQIFPTSGKIIERNFTVNPIPSNYGLVTWNGVTLVIS